MAGCAGIRTRICALVRDEHCPIMLRTLPYHPTPVKNTSCSGACASCRICRSSYVSFSSWHCRRCPERHRVQRSRTAFSFPRLPTLSLTYPYEHLMSCIRFIVRSASGTRHSRRSGSPSRNQGVWRAAAICSAVSSRTPHCWTASISAGPA